MPYPDHQRTYLRLKKAPRGNALTAGVVVCLPADPLAVLEA